MAKLHEYVITCVKIVDFDGGVEMADCQMGRFFIEGDVNDAHRTAGVGKAGLSVEFSQIGIPE